MSTAKKLNKLQRKVAIKHPENLLDKLKLYYFQDEANLLAHDNRIVLTKSQEQTLKKLETLWGLLIQKSPSEVLQWAEKSYKITQRQARNLIKQAEELFGVVDFIKKDTQRVMRIRQREEAIREIKEDEFMEATEKQHLIHLNRKEIEKMLGLHHDDPLSMEEILQKLQQPDVVITSNPSVLDIDHTEATEDE